MTKGIVRKTQFGDEEGIHIAHMKSIKDVCSRDYTPEQINAWGGREYSYESKNKLIKNQHVWVVELNGCIEGYGLLFIDKENKNAEVGASLGYKELFLSSTKTSKKFYEKQGFT